MNNRISWSLLVTGYLILLCSAVTLIPLITGRSTWLVPFGLLGGIFSGISPRMVGRFDFKGAGLWIGGSFPRDEGFLEGGFRRATPNRPEGHSSPPRSNKEPPGD
jgi:hypothetical protein